MRMDERLVKQNKKADERRRKPVDEDEETLRYDDWKGITDINRYKGVFGDEGPGGINTAESVFDRTAVFRTSD
ncbi:MAG: hypothetical protein IKI75_09815 [Lachnospiraceae bacterium]|nr:hypothetical protein [Lachnospiraceae bacterium]